MEVGESINIMYNWFNDIMVTLQNLGKKLALNEINRNLFASLPNEQILNVMTIEKTKNLKTITTEELLGSLITHEHTLEMDQKEKEADKKTKKDLTLQLLVRNVEGLH